MIRSYNKTTQSVCCIGLTMHMFAQLYHPRLAGSKEWKPSNTNGEII